MKTDYQDLITSRQRVSSYDRIAAEYYDPALHPTCADFRDATRILLDKFLDERNVAGRKALELGAGCSLVAERYSKRGISLGTLVVTDKSPVMLSYSEPIRRQGAQLIVGSVETLELPSSGFDFAFACLGDPYNYPMLWSRIAQWLADGGVCFYTTPAFEWTELYRTQYQSGLRDVAEFLVGGEVVYVPSNVLSKKAQRSMVEAAGLRIDTTSSVARRNLPEYGRSPKVRLSAIADDLPIVTSYVIKKPF